MEFGGSTERKFDSLLAGALGSRRAVVFVGLIG